MSQPSPESLFGTFEDYLHAKTLGNDQVGAYSERLVDVLRRAIASKWKVDLLGIPTTTLCEKTNLKTKKSQRLEYPSWGPWEAEARRDIKGAEVIDADHTHVIVLPPVAPSPEDGIERLYDLKIVGQVFPLLHIAHMSWHTPTSEPDVETLMAFEPRETIAHQ